MQLRARQGITLFPRGGWLDDLCDPLQLSFLPKAGWRDSVTTQMLQRADRHVSESRPYLVFNLNLHDTNIFQTSIHSAQAMGRLQLQSMGVAGEMNPSHLPASFQLSQGAEEH